MDMTNLTHKVKSRAKSKIKQNPKKYLITWIGICPGYRTISSLSKLTRTEKYLVKCKDAVLFKAEDGEILPIYLNGKLK